MDALYLLLRVVRGIAGFVGAWQFIGLLSVGELISSPVPVPAGVWFAVILKVAIGVIGLGLFFGLRILVNWLHKRQTGQQHPALVKLWNL